MSILKDKNSDRLNVLLQQNQEIISNLKESSRNANQMTGSLLKGPNRKGLKIISDLKEILNDLTDLNLLHPNGQMLSNHMTNSNQRVTMNILKGRNLGLVKDPRPVNLEIISNLKASLIVLKSLASNPEKDPNRLDLKIISDLKVTLNDLTDLNSLHPNVQMLSNHMTI